MTGRRQDYINYRIQKSVEVFDDATLLAGNKRWNSCVNRLYYSSFYLIGALLYQNEVKSETHNGAKTQFNLHFIKSGKLPMEYGKLYATLFDWRQESDYADFIDFDEPTVLTLLKQVAEMNTVLIELLKTN
ncbi:UPF0332 protein TM_1000 [Filimonas sp.]|nr:UPF0332 protein TM_1000 [Filimonas sp.]